MGMKTIDFSQKGNVRMIAHRGLSGLERENTCPAFVAAGVKSYYGIETDVHLTADGKFILVHDDDLKRIAGKRMVVEKSTFSQLREVRLTDTDGKTERGDLFLPTVEEYLSICRKYDKQAVLEIKNPMPSQNIEALVALIKKEGWYRRTIFISFVLDNLLCIRRSHADAQLQFLTDKPEREFSTLVDNQIDLDAYAPSLKKSIVDKFQDAGRKVNCWTVDKVVEGEKLRDMGVDFITTNILE